MALPVDLPQLTERPALSAYHVVAPDAAGYGCWAFQTSAGPLVPVQALGPPLAPGLLPSYRVDFQTTLPRRRAGGPGWLLLLSLAMWAGAGLLAYCFYQALH